MKIILNKKNLIEIIKNKKKIGFVPTMGAIHRGHISLIKKSIKDCDMTIVSIFINKHQFNEASDYKKYPRIVKKDIEILSKYNVDYVFIPNNKNIYPKGPNKNIKINNFSKKLCGKFRPGHFIAVVDVINKFLEIISPNYIYFGNKDMQQLIILKDFIKKKYNYIKVIGCKTVRERNGIALSSRNILLTKKQKIIGSSIYHMILTNKKFLIRNPEKLKEIKKNILKIGANKIDYIEIVNTNKIINPHAKINKYKIFIAYYLGKTRLIDNI